ncbi:hypothetical protein [Halosimplex marinum]|uniref:hypothetical protein n=1 Tax=Halosimplex marinum TaxID=3396620 RepID=UPI003F5778AB
MKCANCQDEGAPAYTLRAHVERGEPTGESESESGTDTGESARTDGGASATVDLPFCSLECLAAWT